MSFWKAFWDWTRCGDWHWGHCLRVSLDHKQLCFFWICLEKDSLFTFTVKAWITAILANYGGNGSSGSKTYDISSFSSTSQTGEPHPHGLLGTTPGSSWHVFGRVLVGVGRREGLREGLCVGDLKHNGNMSCPRLERKGLNRRMLSCRPWIWDSVGSSFLSSNKTVARLS